MSLQHLRPDVPRHDLRREPWAGDRLRGRWLPAGHCADRSRHPGRSRPAQARPVEIRDPAQGARPGAHSFRRLSGRADEAAGHDGHADCAADRECGRRSSKDYTDIRDKFRPGHADYTYFAKYGVRDYRGGGRSERARDREPRGGGRGGEEGAGRSSTRRSAFAARWCRWAREGIERENWKWAEVAKNPVLLPRSQGHRSVDGISGKDAQGRALRSAR